MYSFSHAKSFSSHFPPRFVVLFIKTLHGVRCKFLFRNKYKSTLKSKKPLVNYMAHFSLNKVNSISLHLKAQIYRTQLSAKTQCAL